MAQTHVRLSIFTSVVKALTRDCSFAVLPNVLTFIVFNPWALFSACSTFSVSIWQIPGQWLCSVVINFLCLGSHDRNGLENAHWWHFFVVKSSNISPYFPSSVLSWAACRLFFLGVGGGNGDNLISAQFTILLAFFYFIFFCHEMWDLQICHSSLSVKLVGEKSSAGPYHTPLFTDIPFGHQASKKPLCVQREITITHIATFLFISEGFKTLMSTVS